MSQTASTHLPSHEKPWPVFITLLLGCFITIEAAAFQVPALPSIAKHFGVNADVTALIILLYYLSLVAFSPVFGRVADRFGRKRVIVMGLSLFAAAEFWAALAPSFTQLLMARFFQGFAVACILPVVLSYAAYLFPPEKRGFPLGVMTFAMSLGGASGAVIGGLMIDHFGWRSIYWVSGVMALIGLALIAWRTPETPLSKTHYKLDLPGTLLLLVSIGTLLSVPTWVSKFGFSSAQAIGAFVGGVGGLLLLWQVEKKAIAPVLDTSILRNRAFYLPGFIYILFLICYGGSIYSLSFFINGRPEGSASQVGLVNTIVLTVSMMAGLVSGKLIDRFNERSIIIIIVGIMFVGMCLYTTIAIDTPLWLIIAIVSVLGVAQGMKGPAITKLALKTVPSNKLSSGSGLFSMMRDFGTPAGVSIGLALFTAQRVASTDASLDKAAAGIGLEQQYVTQLKDAFQQGSLEQHPELAQQLMALGSSFEQVTAPVKAEGLATALPMVGTMLIGVIALAFVLTLLLPKSRPKLAEQQ